MPDRLPVHSHLGEYLRRGLARLRRPNEYHKFLRRITPDLHPAFQSSYLDLVFRKPIAGG